jgi:CRISPR-associated endoribonuclease Cas6
VLSFIKHVLQKGNSDFFSELYATGKPLLKDFTFSVYVPFSKNVFTAPHDKVPLTKNEISISFSIFDYKTFIHFYNMFVNYKGKEDTEKYPFVIKDISSIPQKQITKNQVSIKFLSPLALRQHDKNTNKDYYIDCLHPDFNNQLNISVNGMLQKFELISNDIQIKLEPVAGKSNKTVVKFKNTTIGCSYGQFILSGDIEILNLLYMTGIGSRRSEGFGMFEVLG